jgi:uncharacterized protein with NRDE domain
VSLSNSLTPSGDLGAWRVMESPPVDFASVEYIVSNTSIAEAWKKVRSNRTHLLAHAMVQNSPSGYGPIDT